MGIEVKVVVLDLKHLHLEVAIRIGVHAAHLLRGVRRLISGAAVRSSKSMGGNSDPILPSPIFSRSTKVSDWKYPNASCLRLVRQIVFVASHAFVTSSSTCSGVKYSYPPKLFFPSFFRARALAPHSGRMQGDHPSAPGHDTDPHDLWTSHRTLQRGRKAPHAAEQKTCFSFGK